MTAKELYIEFELDEKTIRSRKTEHVMTRHAIRQYLMSKGLTLRHIGDIEGSIDNGAPVNHSSILSSKKHSNATISEILAKLDSIRFETTDREAPETVTFEREVKKIDVRRAMREAGAVREFDSTPLRRAAETMNRLSERIRRFFERG